MKLQTNTSFFKTNLIISKLILTTKLFDVIHHRIGIIKLVQAMQAHVKVFTFLEINHDF